MKRKTRKQRREEEKKIKFLEEVFRKVYEDKKALF